MKPGLEEIQRLERSLEDSRGDMEERAVVQLRKWSHIEDCLAANPFRVSETLPRSEQWRRVRDHLKANLDEPEMIDWIIQQIDVAANLAAGIHEMRPRKNGPCHGVLMEWVGNRRKKAEAVLKWIRCEFVPDFPSFP